MQMPKVQRVRGLVVPVGKHHGRIVETSLHEAQEGRRGQASLL